MPESPLDLAFLRRRLERIEPRRVGGRGGVVASGHGGVDGALGGGLARGHLHEMFANEGDAGSVAGFATLLGLRASALGRRTLWLRTAASEKRAGRVHGAGLRELGLDPAALLFAVLPDDATLLRAAVDAARCAGLGALLIESRGQVRGLDLTFTRRLMLAAEESGVTVFMLHIAADPSPSAADTRWRVSAAPSIALEANAPGGPMFDIELLRRRAGPPAGPWRLEWDRDTLGFKDPGTAGSPLSRPVLPLVADRAAAAEPAAPRRNTG